MNTCHFSEDRKYRYTLTRSINGKFGKACVFIGLNPSTADESQDDPTIRRCIGYARDWGYEMFTMLNLFAYRSTNPRKLSRSYIEPIGEENDSYILRVCKRADLIIVAWGNYGVLYQRGDKVMAHLKENAIAVHRLGLTHARQPNHPLYLRKDLIPVAVT